MADPEELPTKENIFEEIRKALDEMKNNQTVVRANQFLNEHSSKDKHDFQLDSVGIHKLAAANYIKELNKFSL